ISLQPKQIWVHLTYQTAFVDRSDKLQMRRDVYDLDSRTLAAIKRERGLLAAATDRRREQENASSPGVKRAVRAERTAPRSISYETPGYARSLIPRSIYR